VKLLLSEILKLCLINSFFPSSSPNAFNVFERVGCDTWSCSAAFDIFSSLATARKYLRFFYFHEILHKADYLCVIPKMNIMIFILFISENPAKVLIWKLEGIQKEKYSGG
jgi:hypothetical protein